MIDLLLLVAMSATCALAEFAYDEVECVRMNLYSAAAYCTSYNDAKTFTCASCGLIDSYASVEVFNTYRFAKRDAHASIYINRELKEVVMAFRGTDPKSVENLVADISFLQYEVKGGEVHVGFLDTMVGLRDAGIIDDFVALAEKLPDYKLAVTGHSLGGALALLAAVWTSERLASAGVADYKSRMRLYTFGAPKVGDASWARYANGVLDFRVARVVHWRDIVISVPPFGYKHTKNEVFYQDDMARGDYELCASGTDDCSHDLFFHNSFADHAYYFGIFVGWHCDPAVPTPEPTTAPLPTTSTAPTAPWTGPTKCLSLWGNSFCYPWKFTSTASSMLQTVVPTSTAPVSRPVPAGTANDIPMMERPRQTVPCRRPAMVAAQPESNCAGGLFGVEGVCMPSTDCAAQNGTVNSPPSGAQACTGANLVCCTHCLPRRGQEPPSASAATPVPSGTPDAVIIVSDDAATLSIFSAAICSALVLYI